MTPPSALAEAPDMKEVADASETSSEYRHLNITWAAPESSFASDWYPLMHQVFLHRMQEIRQEAEEYDIEAPSEECIQKALAILMIFGKGLDALPPRICLDGDGGLAITYRSGIEKVRIDVEHDLECRLLHFVNHRLISQQALPF